MNRILIVDDELCKPNNAEKFREKYPLDDLEYVFAGSDEEMFRNVNEDDTIKAVLLDIRFEGEGNEYGLDLLKRLSKEGSPLPVIMMSSLNDAETVIRAWELGAQGYKVSKIESEDGAYEVEMTDKDGVRIETHVHPATGELLPGYDD